MNRIVINIIVTIVCIAATVTFMYYVFFYLFMNLGDWTFKNFQKFLTFQIKPIDHFLVQFSPLIFIYPILKYKLNYWREMLLMTVIGICSIFLSIIAGITVGLYTWGNDKSSPFLPEYILEQPFGNYWTVFILIGIITPIAILTLKNRRKKIEIEKSTID